jgi:phage terminase small subunit
MEREEFILVSHYCEQTSTPMDFIDALRDYGIIEIQLFENQNYVAPTTIVEIERVNRLHHELGINLEGIDALNHILEKVIRLERELKVLRERLGIYEP